MDSITESRLYEYYSPVAAITSFNTEEPTYRNQSNDLQSKSMDWFLYGRELPRERLNIEKGVTSKQYGVTWLTFRPFLKKVTMYWKG